MIGWKAVMFNKTMENRRVSTHPQSLDLTLQITKFSLTLRSQAQGQGLVEAKKEETPCQF